MPYKVPYQVGDRVGFPFGSESLVGAIVEDRGTIGAGGRRLFRVEAPLEHETLVIELPAEELQPA